MIAAFGLLGAIGFSVAGNAITNIAIPWLSFRNARQNAFVAG